MNPVLRRSIVIVFAFILFIPAGSFASAPAATGFPPDYAARHFMASDGEPLDFFGYSFAIDGDWAVVGAYNNTVAGNSGQGAAYVFKRSGASWTEYQVLTAPDGQAEDEFGNAVDISADTILVGAVEDDLIEGVEQGSAYVFHFDGSNWIIQTKLAALDADSGDAFGFALALDGDTALIGSRYDADPIYGQGSTYVFQRIGEVWNFQQKLIPSNPEDYAYFGSSVALDGDLALIGAPEANGTVIEQGTVYSFTRTGSTWVQQGQIFADQPAESALFGLSIALDGDWLLVGAPLDTVGGASVIGAAYLFQRTSSWVQQARLLPADGSQEYDYFGGAVAFSGNVALVGAQDHMVNGNAYQGSAYLYMSSGTDWSMQKQINAPDGTKQDGFGTAVAFEGNGFWVAAPLHGDAASRPGAVYIFSPLYRSIIPLVQRGAP